MFYIVSSAFTHALSVVKSFSSSLFSEGQVRFLCHLNVSSFVD